MVNTISDTTPDMIQERKEPFIFGYFPYSLKKGEATERFL